MDIADSVLDMVGDTPLVRLRQVAAGLPCPVVAKVEMVNPRGSVKDRPAVAMIDAAEREGLLEPGGTIVEPTSGNTGVGLAMVAAQRGYRCIFVMTDKVAPEKVDLLRAYGAEVVVCPVAVPPDDPDGYYSTAERLVREIPGAYRPNQYHNPVNVESHYATTGPEIWSQTDGRVTHFVAGAGTGGTISGVARYLKEQNPAVHVIAADPEGSVFSGGSGRPYLVEGVGEDFWPDTYHPELVDRTIAVSDRDSFLTARRVTQEEGLLIGGSCGTAVHAALEVAAGAGPDDMVVVLLPDSGRLYLSKVFNDEWLAGYGFTTA
ncbi:MAG: PLP-dependent cysteine synthase family protein, partial [Acidimicrobiales bacterium]